ncbi:Mu Gam family protein [gut metagenome]|uniref:Mu Gam family protein n=1 Tax=gut metagenome TaxID=749906 RepID=J9GZ96_9ZZZZ
MAKRVKKTVVTGITREQAEQAFADYAAADAEVQTINAKMDVEITKIRTKYASRLADLDAVKEDTFTMIQAYATENREELFAKKKSIESAHGTFGFRVGMPRLKTLRGFTWAAVLTLCRELLPEYIRTTEDVAKDKLLADRANEEIAPILPRIGVQVVQDETFFIEPKKESDNEPRHSTAS